MISYFYLVLLTVLQSSFKRVSSGDTSSRCSMKCSWSWMRLKQKREGIRICEAHFQKVFMFFLKPFSGRSDYMNVSYLFVFIWTFGWGVYPSWQAHNMAFGDLREKMEAIGGERGEKMWKLKQKRCGGVLSLFLALPIPLFNSMLKSPKMCWKITVIPSKWH